MDKRIKSEEQLGQDWGAVETGGSEVIIDWQ